jgi:AcrR family transcriptional regulator
MPTSTASDRAPASTRQASDARREHLLDVAAEMVAAGDAEVVSMETVALRAGVSRALVYKHFANRQTLLHVLYERESAHLHQSMSDAVQRASTLEDMLHALVTGALAAQSERAATFAALASQGGRPRGQRDLQRRRDAQTLRHFARRAVAEIGLEEAVATTALGLALSSIPIVLGQWRRHPTREYAVTLADTFVRMTMGGLRSLARR